MENLAVLILYFEKPTLTIQCIQSVVKSEVQVYVLNNGSSIGGWEKLKKRFRNLDNIKFIESDLNLGPSGGRNKLINESSEDWLFFLDNDIYIKTKKWLDHIKKHLKKSEEIEAFVPRLYNVHENSFSDFHKYIFENNKIEGIPLNIEKETNYFPGGASIVNRKVFERFGTYDENLFVLEDLEFPIRHIVNNEPIKAKLIDDIILVHNHKYSNRLEDKRATMIRYNKEKNEFAQKYICNKHSITFDSHWEAWVNRQIYLITRHNKIRKFKNWLIKIIKSKFSA